MTKLQWEDDGQQGNYILLPRLYGNATNWDIVGQSTDTNYRWYPTHGHLKWASERNHSGIFFARNDE